MSNLDLLRDLFKKYNLTYDSSDPNSKANDVYKHKHYTIITRQGIQKIERASGIQCTIDIVTPVSDPNNIIMKGFGVNKDGATYTTFGSASAETSQNKYYAEMAEKRVRSRLVLTLAGLYELGVFGEDEADSFSKEVEKQQAQEGQRATYKGKV